MAIQTHNFCTKISKFNEFVQFKCAEGKTPKLAQLKSDHSVALWLLSVFTESLVDSKLPPL